jgi:hypothetical protein
MHFCIHKENWIVVRYNDKSVLENLHVATAFNVLGRAEYFLTLARHYTHPCTRTHTHAQVRHLLEIAHGQLPESAQTDDRNGNAHNTSDTRVFAHAAPRLISSFLSTQLLGLSVPS